MPTKLRMRLKQMPRSLEVLGFSFEVTCESLASRKCCDFENAETLRFEIAPPQNPLQFFIYESLGTFELSLLFHRHKNIAIWNLRFRNAAICDFIPRFFCEFSVEPVVRVAILNVRFENAAIATMRLRFFGTLSVRVSSNPQQGAGVCPPPCGGPRKPLWQVPVSGVMSAILRFVYALLYGNL